MSVSPMPLHSNLRLSAIFLTLAAAVATHRYYNFWLTFVYGFGLSHYFLSYVYAKKQILQIMRRPSSEIAFAATILLGAFLYFSGFPLLIYFGFHHAFNEVYLLDRSVSADARERIRGLRTAGVFLNAFAYFFILRGRPELRGIPQSFLLGGLLISSFSFAWILYRSRASLTKNEIIDNCFLEICYLPLVAASFFFKPTLTHFVCYHLFFWAIYPIPKLARAEGNDLKAYLLTTFLILIPIYLFSPYGIRRYPMSGSWFDHQFYFWSYLHITTSFALSAAHPTWITRWFRFPAVQPG